MTNLDKFQSELGISEEKLTALYNHPDFNGLLISLEESNPRFKDLPDDMKKLAMAMFLQGDTDKISGLWKFFFKRPIPTIEEFLTPEYIGSDASFYKPWSPWYKDLTTVFAPESMIYEWCLCLQQDTMIPLLDGRVVPIKDLVGSDPFYVYSYDEKRNITIGRAFGVRQTGVDEIYRVYLDDGSYIETNSRHELVTINNRKVQVRHLKEGTRLAPFYRKLSEKRIKGYEEVYHPGSDTWELTHKMSGDWKYGNFKLKGDRNVFHHKDFNKLNNSPVNLEIMGYNAHWKYHSNHISKRSKVDLKFREKLIKIGKSNSTNPESPLRLGHKIFMNSEKGKELAIKNLQHWNSNPENLQISKKHFKQGAIDFWNSEAGKKEKEKRRINISLDEIIKKTETCTSLNEVILSFNIKTSKPILRVLKEHNYTWKSFSTKFCKKLSNISKCKNHKVVRIERTNRIEPVFCMTVDRYHNFAILSKKENGETNDSGVISGNTGCIGSAKSSVSRIAQFYNLYRITSLRYPQLALGTGETKPMCLIFLTVNKLKASESMVSIKTLLKQCKYFIKVQNEKEFVPYLDNEFCQYVPYYEHKVEDFERVTFPNNVYVSLGTQLNHTIGSDLFGAVLDEAEFKKGPNASKDAYDFYTELLSRVTTRFIDTKYKLVTLVSSVKHDTGVISKHIEDLKYKKGYAYLSSYPIWEVKEQYRGAFEKYGHFYALRGTMSHPSKILDEIEYEQMENGEYICPDNCKVIKVPKHPMLVSPFLANPDRALKEQAGEATSGGERPFDNLSSLEDLNLAGEITLSASLTEKKSLFDQLPELLWQKTPAGLKLKRFPNAPRYCFTGDTKVKLLSGVSKTMKELTEDYNNGIINWVYSWSEQGWRPGLIESAHISSSVTELVQLTLDNGEKIRCTPDHRFMLRDGTYLEAKNLKESQSLMPCYSYITSEGYEKLVDNRKNKEVVHTHRISDHLLKVLPFSENDTKYIRHHINENKLDNTPTNLIFMGDSSHMKYHYGSSTSFRFRDKKEQSRRGAKIMGDNWHGLHNEEWRAKLKPVQAASGKLKFTKYNEERFNGKDAIINREWARANLLAIKNNPKNQEKIKETNSRLAKDLSIKYNSDPVVIKKRQIGRTISFARYLIEKGVELNKENWNQGRYAPLQRTWDSAIELVGSKEKILELATINHKVQKIEFITLETPEEVYDLTIDDGLNSHNFVLEAGVVVENCHLDLADSGEAGISMCHKEVSSLGQIIYVFDFVAKVVSPTRISQTMIEEFIVDLKEVGSIMIELLSADQYQSTYLRERLENQHKVAKYVKRVPIGGRTNIEPVLTTAVLISEGAVKIGPCVELKQQLRGVFIYNDLLEYETERKDMVDTFVGTLYGALNSSTDIPTNIYESYERITKTLDLSMLDGLQEL